MSPEAAERWHGPHFPSALGIPSAKRVVLRVFFYFNINFLFNSVTRDAQVQRVIIPT